MKLPFKSVYAFRPGLMKPAADAKNVPSWGRYILWLYPVIHALAPGSACTLSEVGVAMINAVNKGYEKQVLEVKDIVALSEEIILKKQY
jgi:hypothetical protein